MKKFLRKLFVYFLLLSTVTLIINALYIYRAVYREIGMFADGVPYNIQICNFGSSHGLYGFDYEDLKNNFTCFNFALSSQSLLYDYKILMNYKDKIQNGAVVFILASYFSFFGKPEVEEPNFLSKNRRYYKILPSNLIEQYDWKTDLYVNYFPALSGDDLFAHITKLFPDEDITWEKETNAHDAEEDAINRSYKGHIVNNKDENGKMIYKKEAFDALYGMINICREIGARPILITTPFTHEYTETVRKNDPAFFGEFYSIINKVRKDTGIEYYDYSNDERYVYDYTLFFDSDHMNKKGARKFTNNLVKEVLRL